MDNKITFNNILDLIEGNTDITLYVNGKIVDEKFRPYNFSDRYDLHDYYSYRVEGIEAVGEKTINLYIEN